MNMTLERQAELTQELVERGYTFDNFKCVSGITSPSYSSDKICARFTTNNPPIEGVHWGCNWVMLDGKWAEFKDKSYTNLYPIY